MKRISVSLLLTFGLLTTMVGSAGAITNGTLDGEGHPQVVLLLMEVDNAPAFRCSGTLLSATVLLTAGHCTSNFPDSPYTGMRVFYESDVQGGIGSTNNYPNGNVVGAACYPDCKSIEAEEWAAHPLYETGPFFLHDAGVVILEEPVPGVSAFGTLPSVNQFDSLRPGRSTTFTSVGYGLQKINPVFVAGARVRMVAYPWLLQINVPGFTGDFSMLLSNNHSSGGTCFGDSGGPNFLGNSLLVAGITSFGINGNCAGTGGVFRTDRLDVLNFINGYLN